jgi:hypothetical protein
MENEEEVTLEEIAWIAYIMVNSQFRIYDALVSLLAATAGSDKAKQLQQLHEQGKFLFPPPHLQQEEEPDGE